LHKIDWGNMRALGTSLIVAGLGLVCGALMLWPRASQTEEEDKTESRTDEEEKTESRKEENTEMDEMSELLRRLNESPTMIPSNKQRRKRWRSAMP
jgi:type VI protein secretion system component VasK